MVGLGGSGRARHLRLAEVGGNRHRNAEVPQVRPALSGIQEVNRVHPQSGGGGQIRRLVVDVHDLMSTHPQPPEEFAVDLGIGFEQTEVTQTIITSEKSLGVSASPLSSDHQVCDPSSAGSTTSVVLFVNTASRYRADNSPINAAICGSICCPTRMASSNRLDERDPVGSGRVVDDVAHVHLHRPCAQQHLPKGVVAEVFQHGLRLGPHRDAVRLDCVERRTRDDAGHVEDDRGYLTGEVPAVAHAGDRVGTCSGECSRMVTLPVLPSISMVALSGMTAVPLPVRLRKRRRPHERRSRHGLRRHRGRRRARTRGT